MKKYIAHYYLLFVLLILGAFASMAQNDYGFKILGGVTVTFTLLFLIQFVSSATGSKKISWLDMTELGSLIVLSSVLALRVFYIHFQFVENLFVAAGIALSTVYLFKLVLSWRKIKPKNITLAFLIAVFHLSIIFYTISMTVVPFLPSMAEPAGGIGFSFLLVFMIAAFIKKKVMVDGEKISAFKFVYRFKDRSVVLLALFLIFTAYMGLTKIGVLPKMYSNEFPQAYFKLVNRAELGLEEPENGKYRHEEFINRYNEFLNRHGESNKK